MGKSLLGLSVSREDHYYTVWPLLNNGANAWYTSWQGADKLAAVTFCCYSCQKTVVICFPVKLQMQFGLMTHNILINEF